MPMQEVVCLICREAESQGVEVRVVARLTFWGPELASRHRPAVNALP